MSAFVVSDKHINTLVTWAANKDVYYRFNGGDWTKVRGHEREIATMLHNQNVRSVNYRYNEHEDDGPFVYKPAPLLGSAANNALQILKACACYDYQSCETDDYDDTPAAHIIDSIRYRAISDATDNPALMWEIK